MNRRRALVMCSVAVLCLLSWGGQVSVQGQEGDGLWQAADARTLTGARANLAGAFRVLRLNQPRLAERLQQAPLEAAEGESRALGQADVRLVLPVPEGGFLEFRIEESPILVPELAAAFPGIRTYRGVSVENPSVTTRFDWTPDGFHAIVFGHGATVYIDPLERGNVLDYVVYRPASALRGDTPFTCLINGDEPHTAWRPLGQFPFSNGTTRRTYRLALAATGEYTTAAGGSKAAALSRMTTTMNRVNGIYERELAVRMTLSAGTVADPTALIYTNGGTDPYSNSNGSAMLNQNQTNLDSVVGFGNYDVGHVFSTGGGGVAYLGAVCSVNKARGVTGSSSPTGDGFDVDYVAHEMGHQFGANHTFNGTSGSCGGGNRAGSHAYEPGSGSTIMSYAGICDAEDVQRNSHDYFHVDSLNEMTAFLTSGGGSTCGSAAATGNVVPSVGGGGAFTIPASTPFALSASASDANGDALTYTWEQYNAGTASSSVATASTDDGSRVLFRTYAPSAAPVRTFPSLPFILNNGNVPPSTFAGASGVGSVTCSYGTCLTGETLPTTNRTMTFQVTVRDQRGGGGAIATLGSTVTVSASAGPFAVTSPNSAVSIAGGSAQTVTWQVAGTNAAPVNTASVNILLSTDGGASFPTVLAASVPNTGSASVVMPAVATATARIKVEAVGNVFFDVSNTNFTITSGGVTPPPAPGGGTPAAPGCSTVQILANPVPPPGVGGVDVLWQSSGVTVTAGEAVTVTASGTWVNGAQSITANGDPAQPVSGANAPLVSGAGLMALIGRIGPAGTPFLVGASTTFTATATGVLYFAPQDNWYLAWDNAGSLSLSVCRGTGGACSYTLTPTSGPTLAASGGAGSFAVTAGSGCAWTPVATAAWVHVTGGSGPGSGTVTYTVDTNTGAARTAGITVGTQTFTVAQTGTSGGGSSGGVTPPATGGCGSVLVSANPVAPPGVGGVDVLWQSSGISVTAGETVTVTASGSWLNGAQALTANGDPAQPVTGTNAPLSGAGLLALIGRIGPAGEPFVVGASRTWTAAASGVLYFAPQDNWYLTWDNSGSLSVSVCRSGGGGGTSSGSACSYSLAPSGNASMAAAGGSGSFAVTAGATCAWTPTPTASWLRVTGGTGPGSATVTYAADSNTGAARTAGITVGDQTFTVTQAGSGGATTPGTGACTTLQVLANPPATPGVGGVDALWQSTGVTVAAGETLTVTASGTWLNGAQTVTANGDPAQVLTGQNVPLPGQPMLALVGRIGPAGEPFLVGASRTVTASASGVLYLAPQDYWYYTWDNSGALSVSVCRGGAVTPGGSTPATGCGTALTAANPTPPPGVGGVDVLWQSSGVAVTAGQVVTVTASGTWVNGGQALTANGDPAQPFSGANVPLSGAPLLSLIGRLGPAGTPFLVGSSRTWTAEASGVLYFAPQDYWYYTWDNSGSLTVSVCR